MNKAFTSAQCKHGQLKEVALFPLTALTPLKGQWRSTAHTSASPQDHQTSATGSASFRQTQLKSVPYLAYKDKDHRGLRDVQENMIEATPSHS